MPEFSEKSLSILETCDHRLIRLCADAIEVTDFSVIHGFRDKALQNSLVRAGASNRKWPKSNHNKTPSMAVDLAPWPIDWEDIGRFHFLAGVLRGLMRRRNFDLGWGGNWTGKAKGDYGHFEIKV